MVSDLSKIQANLNKYIVSPANLFGFAGFVFDIEDTSTVNLTNEITDHYIESNSTINDHIAVRPKTISLRNFIGELSTSFGNGITDNIQRVIQKLTTVTSIAPDLTSQARQFYQNASQTIEQLGSEQQGTDFDIDSTSDLYKRVKDLIAISSKQQTAYQYFLALQQQRVLFSVQTPFEFMTNMAIESVVATQDAVSREVTEFNITLKEIRTATVEVRAISRQGRRARQAQANQDLGNAPGKDVTPERQSTLFKIFSGF